MPMVTAYENGFSVGCAGKGGAREKTRARNTGWSAGATRRNRQFLQSIQCDELDGDGYAVTLTVREVPESAEAYSAAVKRFFERLRVADVVRWHRVIELTKRRRPHLHCSVYFHEGWVPPGAPIGYKASAAVRAAWVHRWVAQQWQECAGDFGVQGAGQDVKRIEGVLGWLQYQAKHADRGFRHYQRDGMPPGWASMPQVWSKGGSWPTQEPMKLALTLDELARFRRLQKRLFLAERRTELRRAEKAGDVERVQRARRSIGFLRRSLQCSDRGLSAVRGAAGWCSQETAIRLALAVGWDGELVAA